METELYYLKMLKWQIGDKLILIKKQNILMHNEGKHPTNYILSHLNPYPNFAAHQKYQKKK